MARKTILIFITIALLGEAAGFADTGPRSALSPKLTLPTEDFQSAIQSFARQEQSLLPKTRSGMAEEENTIIISDLRNLIAGYRRINAFLDENHEFDPNQLLELNRIICYGEDFSVHMHFLEALRTNEKKFWANYQRAWKWYKSRKARSAAELAAGVFVRIVNKPQAWIEGNKRSSSLFANYILLRSKVPPFIITAENISGYYRLARDIQFLDASGVFGAVNKIRLFLLQRRMEKFISENLNTDFLTYDKRGQPRLDIEKIEAATRNLARVLPEMNKTTTEPIPLFDRNIFKTKKFRTEHLHREIIGIANSI